MTTAAVALSNHIDTMTRDEIMAELETISEIWSQAMTLGNGAADRMLMPVMVLLAARLVDLGETRNVAPSKKFRALCAEVMRANLCAALERRLAGQS